MQALVFHTYTVVLKIGAFVVKTRGIVLRIYNLFTGTKAFVLKMSGNVFKI
jgi:hypothetical protein